MLTKHYGMFAAQLLARCNATRNVCAMQVKLNMLNLVFNFYKTAPPRRGVLEKTGGEKHSKCRVFFIFSVSFFFVLGSANLCFAPFCLSSLLANSLFLKPNNALLAPKIPLFNDHFALFGHVFNGTKGEYLYHCSVFLCFSPCV